MKEPIDLLRDYATYIHPEYSDEEMFNLIHLVMLNDKHKERDILMVVNNALYHHFNEESDL